LQQRVRLIVAERARMHGLLDAIPGVTPLPSEANFILCRLPEGRGKDVHERLAGRGVFVRYYARGVLADYLRISVGTPADTDRLIASLIEALSEH
ncbi:MAG: histidinol-phosphate aminotransferase, partial [Chloroflexi bacterium]|nr:histidinol-phosphate aminotransferase [Chloroflexota bacterium]